MLDANWESISGPVAADIELRNAANQINVMEVLITFHLAHRGPMGNGNPPMPDEAMLLELHRAATLCLLAEPGCYRNLAVDLKDSTGTVVYMPPEWQLVLGHMKAFFRELSSLWSSGNSDALDIAAYALWAINWVHPFRNGNGRTARAFAYACLSLRLAAVLPGTPTVIDQIMANRGRYQDALKVADASLKAGTPPDLGPMKAFLSDLLQIQIRSVQPGPPAATP